MTTPLGYPVEPAWRLVLKDLGVDERAVLRRASLPEDLLSRTGTVVRTGDYFRLWEALEAEVDDPVFPIRLNNLIRTEHFMPSVFAALCSPDFLTAAQRISRYKRLMSPQRMGVDVARDRITVTKEWIEAAPEPPTSLVAMELVFLVQLARTATREHVKPERVETPRPALPPDPYERYFGVPVLKGKRHLIQFSLRDATRPFLTANETMWNTFEPELRRRLAQLDEAATVAERVRAAFLEALPSGRVTMDSMAVQLGMSKRTLQRKLRAEDTSFNSVLKNTREDLARHYLTRTPLTAAEISFLLGFQEPNSFIRAFHEWTGQTPERLRAAAS